MDHAEPSSFWLHEVRREYGLGSEAELARHLGLTRSAVNQLMLGKTKMGVKTAVNIGGMLNVDPLLILSSVLSLVEDEHQSFWQNVFNERINDQK
jgi:plasmid maintenance system antidote protein VapI